MTNTIKIRLDREGEILESDTIVDREGIVVVLDALGMKRALLEYYADDIFYRWKQTIENFQYEITYGNNNCFFRVFSDTIIITCYNTNNKNRQNLIDFIGSILINNLVNGIRNGIFFRGTLSYGSYSESTRLVLGDAINKAAACHEKVNWVGLSLFPGIHYLLHNIDSNNFIKYNILYKEEFTNFTNGFALNWIKNPKSNECYEILLEKQNQYEGTKYSNYYGNTIKFYEYLAHY